ncbi:SGNH/GDSL hydrolase family protein [Nocardioides koreensis]|uniref:SGNH/GDSL hydrolase family protein n=1 Tax=Nocardioides koreensis TaxID=433651 RepID=A0ABN2Z1X2_9ACTN
MHGGAVVTVLVALLLGPALLGPVPRASAPSPRVDYVALGDSYSAGPFIPAQVLMAGTCLRSTHNYPSLLARMLQVRSFADMTCTGADTTDLTRSVPNKLPGPPPQPQLDALGPGTDLVTLGIGGNDFGLFGAVLRRCSPLARSDPTGAPCRNRYTVDGVDTKSRDAAGVEGRVAAVLSEIRRRAPGAEVWVIGYPRLFPERGTCPGLPFAEGDYRWADRIERLVNESLRSAAESVGAGFVDLYAGSRGHDVCAGSDAWVNGARQEIGRAAAFHPFREGMEAAARTIRRQLVAESALPFPLLSP